MTIIIVIIMNHYLYCYCCCESWFTMENPWICDSIVMHNSAIVIIVIVIHIVSVLFVLLLVIGVMFYYCFMVITTISFSRRSRTVWIILNPSELWIFPVNPSPATIPCITNRYPQRWGDSWNQALQQQLLVHFRERQRLALEKARRRSELCCRGPQNVMNHSVSTW